MSPRAKNAPSNSGHLIRAIWPEWALEDGPNGPNGVIEAAAGRALNPIRAGGPNEPRRNGALEPNRYSGHADPPRDGPNGPNRSGTTKAAPPTPRRRAGGLGETIL
jgi:hypothetical protein